MILWDRVKKSLDNGVEQVVRVSKTLSERAKIEAAITRLLIDKGTLETRMERAQKKLGERVFLLWELKREGIMSEPEVVEALREIADTRDEIAALAIRIQKISLGEEDE
jgi:hypothetical protein